MSRRVRKTTSLLAPAGNLLKRLSMAKARSRRQAVRYGLWAVVILLGYSFMSGTYGVPRIIRLEMEYRAVAQANHDLIVDMIDSDRVREMLRDDRQYIEMIARTRYHMAKPNESVFRYRGQ